MSGDDVDADPVFAEGSIVEVPDERWGFVAPARTWHPGACTEIRQNALRAKMHKGTGAEEMSPRYRARYYLVEPTWSNGLRKDTAFELDGHCFKRRPMALLSLSRHIGTLDPSDLAALRARALRAIGRR